jgi:methylenetetrahydrofolate reductase (NADPH)
MGSISRLTTNWLPNSVITVRPKIATPYQERAAPGHGSLDAGVINGCGGTRVSIVGSARIVTRTAPRAYALVIEFSFAADATRKPMALIRTTNFMARPRARTVRRMNALMQPAQSPSHNLKQDLREFVAAGSTEITPHDESRLDEFARLVPPQMCVYVAHTPKASLDDVVRVALRLRAHGLTVSPHVVARRVADSRSLRRALQKLVSAGVEQILLIAGDRAVSQGCFTSTLELLESRVTLDAGIRRIGVAGHPEGHPVVPEATLWEALAQKQAFAETTGTRMHVATQFGFDARALGIWERGLASRGITLPVHAGVAGPTPLSRLIKYALQCGVGASLQAVTGNALSIGRLPHLVTRVDEMVLGVYAAKQATPDSRIFAPHFFAFGGVLETARWLRAVTAGSFELNEAGTGFAELET